MSTRQRMHHNSLRALIRRADRYGMSVQKRVQLAAFALEPGMDYETVCVLLDLVYGDDDAKRRVRRKLERLGSAAEQHG